MNSRGVKTETFPIQTSDLRVIDKLAKFNIKSI
jgi:hypothetical protein